MSVWPAWKVREHGGATTSWYHVQLAFRDGARVDALAVLRDGRVSIEDVSAQPALSLADLTVLADWIEGPLSASCGLAPERPHEGQGQGEGQGDRHAEGRHEPAAYGREHGPVADGPDDGPVTDGALPQRVAGRPEREPMADHPVHEPMAHCTVHKSVPDSAVHKPVLDGTVHEPGADGAVHEPTAYGTVHKSVPDSAVHKPVLNGTVHKPVPGGHEESGVLWAGPRRARPGWPRGAEGRWLVAQEYRTAQERGSDPVLAVMSATGHSRRRSLRLIARARDAGYLTPRHARRH